MNYKKLIINIGILGILLFISTNAVFAITYTPLEGDAFPGVSQNVSKDLGAYLSNIFSFGIAIAVALALIYIIWGGIIKMTTDSWQGKDEAKSKITNAIYGLGLTLISWLLLYTINPNLVTFSGNTFLNPPPKSTEVRAPNKVIKAPTTKEVNGVTMANECTGKCVDGASVGLTCKDPASCTISEYMALKLVVALKDQGVRITEAYPPTVPHFSKCHQDGSCVDLNFIDTNNTQDPVKVAALAQRIENQGLAVVFETVPGDCPRYNAAGVKICTSPTTMTAPSFHIRYK